MVAVGGDMPWLSPDVLSLLVDRLRSGDVDAAALELSGEGQPLPLAVSRSALVTIRGLLAEGDRSLRSMLARTRVDLVDESAWRSLDPTARTLADIDVPADLMSGGDRTV